MLCPCLLLLTPNKRFKHSSQLMQCKLVVHVTRARHPVNCKGTHKEVKNFHITHHASDRCHCSVGIRHTVGNQACSKSWWNQRGLCQDTAKQLLVWRWLRMALVAAACGLYCQRILIALLETVLRQFCTGIGFCLPLDLTAESSLRPATQAVQTAQSSLQHGFGQQIAGRSFGMKTRLREAAARKPMLIKDVGFWGFPARERVRSRPVL